MELHGADLVAFVGLAMPDAPEERRARQLERIREAVESGDRQLADTRVAKDAAGELRAALKLAPLGGESFMLIGPFGDDDAAAELVSEAMQRAQELGATGIVARPDATKVGPRYRVALLDHGFEDLGERVEFKASVADLPLDDGTQLRWLDVPRDRAAAMLGEVAAGDPHGEDEREHPHETLASWLDNPKLTSGRGCVQVGFEGDRTVAFVCAQVAPHDGWSRITYMGLVPAARGRGLGTWVHRRGFRMLRNQGGKTYHGGTAATNKGMLQLFREHGCEETRRTFELEWHAPDE